MRVFSPRRHGENSDAPTVRKASGKSDAAIYGLLALFGLGIALLVSPAGEFPVHDDWAYYRITRHFLETGEFRYVGWNQMLLLVQVWAGALVATVFGFSFTTLRIAVLLTALGALLLLYRVLREDGAAPRAADAATLCLAVNPLFLYLAYSFMTEAPFLLLYLAGLLYAARACRSGSRADLALATAWSLAAFLQRQNGLALPLGTLLYAGWQSLVARRVHHGDTETQRSVDLSPLPPPRSGEGEPVVGLSRIRAAKLPGGRQAPGQQVTPPRFRGQEPSTGEARLGRAADSAGGRAPGEATPGAGERLTDLRASVVRPLDTNPRLRDAAIAAGIALAVALPVLVWRERMPYNQTTPPVALEHLAHGLAGLRSLAVLILARLFCATQYLGLFALPLTLAAAPQIVRAVRARPSLCLGVSVAVVGAFLVLRRLPPELTAMSRLMPYLQDNFSAWGYGVPSLYLQGEALPLFGRLGRALLTLIALAGSVALMMLASAPGKRQPLAAHPAAALAGIQLVLQLVFLLTVSTRLFDRYFVLLLALALVVVVAKLRTSPPARIPGSAGVPPACRQDGGTPRKGRLAARGAAALVGLVFLSYGLTTQHDYLARQGAVTRAWAWLAARGIPPLRRDTGFEWDGWDYPDPIEPVEGAKPAGAPDAWYLWRLFPRIRDDYVLSLSPLPGRPELARFGYRIWLPPATRAVHVMGSQSSLRSSGRP